MVRLFLMPCYSPIKLRAHTDTPQRVPCGRCLGCHLERSRQWAMRCVHEARYHEANSFITLTYRDEELIYGGSDRPTLYPRHLTLFLKKLRKEINVPIRYFACGEYGSRYSRPHYHALIFGYDFPDKKICGTKGDNHYYSSDMLNRIWGYGNTIIGAVTFESAAYIARYTLKKKYGQDGEKWKNEYQIEQEFLRMSLKPGIGYKFYEQFKDDIYPHDYLIIRDGIKCKPARYYNKLYQKSNPQEYEELINKRKLALNNNWMDNTKKRLAVKCKVKLAAIKSLTRDID